MAQCNVETTRKEQEVLREEPVMNENTNKRILKEYKELKIVYNALKLYLGGNSVPLIEELGNLKQKVDFLESSNQDLQDKIAELDLTNKDLGQIIENLEKERRPENAGVFCADDSALQRENRLLTERLTRLEVCMAEQAKKFQDEMASQQMIISCLTKDLDSAVLEVERMEVGEQRAESEVDFEPSGAGMSAAGGRTSAETPKEDKAPRKRRQKLKNVVLSAEPGCSYATQSKEAHDEPSGSFYPGDKSNSPELYGENVRLTEALKRSEVERRKQQQTIDELNFKIERFSGDKQRKAGRGKRRDLRTDEEKSVTEKLKEVETERDALELELAEMELTNAHLREIVQQHLVELVDLEDLREESSNFRSVQEENFRLKRELREAEGMIEEKEEELQKTLDDLSCGKERLQRDLDLAKKTLTEPQVVRPKCIVTKEVPSESQKQENERLSQQVSCLERNVALLQGSLDSLGVEHGQVRDRLYSVDNKKRKLQEELAALQRQRQLSEESLKKQISTLERQLRDRPDQKTQQENLTLRKEVQDLRQGLKEQSRLMQENIDKQRKAENLQKELDATKKTLEELAAVQSQRELSEESLKNQISTLERRLRDREADRPDQKMQQENLSLRKEVDDLRRGLKEQSRLMQEHNDLRVKAENLQKELDETKKTLTKPQVVRPKCIITKEVPSESQKQENERLSQQVSCLERNVALLQGSLDSLGVEHGQVRDRLYSVDNKKRKLQEELAALQRQRQLSEESLKKQISTLERQLRDRPDQKTQQENLSLTKEHSRLMQENNGLQRKAEKLQKALDATKKTLEEFQLNKQSQQKENERLCQKVSALESSVASVQRSLESVNEKHSQMQARLHEEQMRNKNLQLELQDQRTEHEGLMQKMQSGNQKLAGQLRDREADQRNEKLQRENQALRQEVDDFKQGMKDNRLVEENNRLKVKAENLLKGLGEATKTLQQLVASQQVPLPQEIAPVSPPQTSPGVTGGDVVINPHQEDQNKKRRRRKKKKN